MQTQTDTEKSTPTMWSSPEGRHAASRQLTAGLSSLDKYGEDVWERITFLSADNEPFRLMDVAKWLASEHRLAIKTAERYVRVFFAYCLAAPGEFSGPSSRLVRCANNRWQLLDNPER